MKKYQFHFHINEVNITAYHITETYYRVGFDRWEVSYDCNKVTVCPYCGQITNEECGCDNQFRTVTTTELREELNKLYTEFGEELFWVHHEEYIPMVCFS